MFIKYCMRLQKYWTRASSLLPSTRETKQHQTFIIEKFIATMPYATQTFVRDKGPQTQWPEFARWQNSTSPTNTRVLAVIWAMASGMTERGVTTYRMTEVEEAV